MDNQKIKANYILIGGKGFIGNSFSMYLRKLKGIEPIIIQRGDLRENNIHSFVEQLKKQYNLGCTENIIVDFAYTSVPNTSFENPVKDFSENLFNVNIHLNFSQQIPNACYIYVSSGGAIYGNVEELIPIKESAPNFPLSPYGITKLASEKYIWMHKEIFGLDIKIVRPSNVYGPGQRPYRGQGFISTAIGSIIEQKTITIFGNGENIRDYIYITDFCLALDAIISYGKRGEIYNVGSGIGHTLNNIIDILNSHFFSSKYAIVETKNARPYDVEYNVLDCTKLKSLDYNFIPTPIDAGINETIKWLKKYF